ncbi:MAG: N-acetylmuramoyl-L-alanine amidase [Firmicutes bacterium]|jgi:N-acetylmuramoyl-L-alanine amidase|nr:N-acetylmuramoyl-L-alanine amidase [Bacillota bacterium]NBI64426.1 N-acetylmuramoyl-L-alanine amidase [Clostridiales bacterium]
MRSIYLSPSVQEHNQYVTGTGSEEYYMNLITDAMVPYLRANEIAFVRNNPYDTLSQVVAQSNAGSYDFHLALHSNTAPENLSGALQGPDIYYYADSREGKRAADIFAAGLKEIYPNPNLVATIPNATLGELKKTKAPVNLIELAYHDNQEDAQWIIDHIHAIARGLSMSLAAYFAISFSEPSESNE